MYAMANDKKPDFDWQGRFFDVVLEDLRDIKKSLYTNTKETREARKEASAAHRKAEEVNGAFVNIKERLSTLEDTQPVKKTSDLPKWYKDPNLMNFLKLATIAVIIIVVAVVLFTKNINLLEPLI